MPPSFFKPVGQVFIDHYNRRYNMNWGPEWANYSLAYFIYTCVGGQNNFSHPGFDRSAPAELQVNLVMKISYKSCNEILVKDAINKCSWIKPMTKVILCPNC